MVNKQLQRKQSRSFIKMVGDIIIINKQKNNHLCCQFSYLVNCVAICILSECQCNATHHLACVSDDGHVHFVAIFYHKIQTGLVYL